jgi:hypothetical protein
VVKQYDPYSDQAGKRKRTTCPKQKKIHEVVYQWYNQQLVQAAAERFAQRLGVQIGFLDSVRNMVLQTEVLREVHFISSLNIYSAALL